MPAPGQYETADGFDLKWREQEEGTANFREAVPKKIVPVNLYNPHAEPEGEKTKQPECATYKVQRLFDVPEQPENEEYEPRLNNVQGGKIYIENNLDRFGQPIRPMKPLNIVPGPGMYEVQKEAPLAEKWAPENLYYPEEFPQTLTKGGYISNVIKPREIPSNTEKGLPGPSYYTANKEPKKISFLFNPAEHWVQ